MSSSLSPAGLQTQQKYAPIRVEFANPFLKSVVSVFRSMLDCELQRGDLSLKRDRQPVYEVSGIIGLSGGAVGTVVLSFGRSVALSAAEVMFGERYDSITSDVVDMVGELTNIIAGSAKAELAEFAMSISLPNVIVGKNHIITFPADVVPLCIPYDCEWGELCLEVGLAERKASV